jgi:hypothetical protein
VYTDGSGVGDVGHPTSMLFELEDGQGKPCEGFTTAIYLMTSIAFLGADGWSLGNEFSERMASI